MDPNTNDYMIDSKCEEVSDLTLSSYSEYAKFSKYEEVSCTGCKITGDTGLFPCRVCALSKQKLYYMNQGYTE